ncbi:MAG: hypothetical protein ACE3K2_15175 [Paenibacillus sp.]|uniref:hypothetical protein n=1 Tax=Paenibacillus sp. TaxID=58172 RepID=UPI003B775CB6
MKKSELVNFLKAITDVVAEMNEKEYEELLSGNGKFEYLAKDSHISTKQLDKPIDPFLIDAVNKLNEFNDRNGAEEFLLQKNITKNDLSKISSMLDIYVNKSDAKEKIIDKIIESTVGARIRSQAIKDTKLKKSSDTL